MKKPQKLLGELGIHSGYRGYHYLNTTLEMALEDENNLTFFSKTIFPTVAKKHQASLYNVECNIRTVIRHCWDSPNRDKLQEIAPYTLDHKPTVGEFIDILYWHLKSTEDLNTSGEKNTNF